MNSNLLSKGIIINKQEQLKIMGGVRTDCGPGIQNPTVCIDEEDCP